VNVTQANVESKDDDNKAMTPYEKFTDGFDSNGFVSALMTYNKNNGVSQNTDDASVLYDFDLCTLSQILDHNLEEPLSLMVGSNTVALPDQMAQAGFYHQPSSSGEDRAMCFTCNVCLVCWEKTDEPWSEHERHSPLCPFVKGEYTQNVPLSITYATNPALPAPGLGFDIISNSDYANVLCTSCSQTGELSVWSIERHLKLMHSIHVPTLLKDVFEESFEWARVTAICVLPNARARTKVNYVYSPANYGGAGSSSGVGSHSGSNAVSSGKFGSVNAQHITSTSTLRAGVVGSKIVLGVSVRQSSGELALRMVVLNIVEVDRSSETSASVSNDSGSVSSVGGQLMKSSSPMVNGKQEHTVL